MESTNSKLLYYFIWTLAAGVLLYFGESVLQHYMEKSYKTFEISGTIWVSVIVPFIYGLHMALLDGLPRAFRPNWPLFILVFLPSFLLLMYPILTIHIEIIRFRPIYEFATLHHGIIFGILSGLTLIRSQTTNKRVGHHDLR